MPKSIERAADRKCCNCGTNCDEKSKVIPVSVTDADRANGKPELWCPLCFTMKRMALEPERYNASCTMAVKCQFCGTTSVCFFVQRGGAAACAACGKGGALPVRPSKEDMDAMFSAVRNAAEEAGILKDVVRK